MHFIIFFRVFSIKCKELGLCPNSLPCSLHNLSAPVILSCNCNYFYSVVSLLNWFEGGLIFKDLLPPNFQDLLTGFLGVAILTVFFSLRTLQYLEGSVACT